MPRYFFHMFDGHLHQDENGEEMQDDQAAWLGAIELARSIGEGPPARRAIELRSPRRGRQFFGLRSMILLKDM